MHPTHAAALVREFKQLPADVDVIVEQHHELPDGTGFPAGLKHQKISPITAVFILAHRLYTFNSHHQQPGSIGILADFEKSLPDTFQVGEFKKVIQVLRKA